MLKNLLIGTAICIGIVCFAQTGKAQQLSKEELKLIQQTMKDSLNSTKYVERQAKLDELLTKPPATCGLASIDGLATSSKTMIDEQKKTNDLLKTYVGKLTEDKEGETAQQTGNKVTLADIIQLSTNIANQVLAAANALVGVTAVAGDVTKVNPMKMGVAKKSIVYSKDALVGLGIQLKAELNIVKQLQTYAQAVKNL